MPAALLLALLAPAGEPEYAGRPLSGWATQLADADTPRRRKAAAIALGQLGTAHPETLPVVLAALGKAARTDASPDVRRQAVAAVAQQKPDASGAAVPDLTECLRAERDPGVRLEAATALGRFGPAAAPAIVPLVTCLDSPDARLRAAAAAALARVGPPAAPAVPALLGRLADPDPLAKREAVAALGRVGPAEPAAVAVALVRLLPTSDPGLKREAVDALGRLGDRSPATVRAVALVLADPRPDLRLAALDAVRRFGPDAAAELPGVLAAFRTDPDDRVREAAARTVAAVKASDPPGLAAVLVERLAADRAAEVRVAVVDLLGGLPGETNSVTPALRQARTDPDPRVRQAAGEALRRVEPRR